MGKLITMYEAVEQMKNGQVFAETVDESIWTDPTALKNFVDDAVSIDGDDALRGREGTLYENWEEFEKCQETWD
jgi:hypothetical protein